MVWRWNKWRCSLWFYKNFIIRCFWYKKLIAKWSPITYKIYYKNIEGTEIEEGTYVEKIYGEEVILREGITKTGYKFEGWYRDDKTYKNVYDGKEDISDTEGEDQNIYAKWRAITYTIRYEIGGEFAVKPEDIKDHEYGTKITLSKPTGIKAGWTFVGWYKDAKLEEKDKYDGNSDLSSTEGDEVTIYAKWKVKITYNDME